MIRTVLAVLLATALLSMTLPAIDAAGEQRTADRLERASDDITTEATALLEEEPGATRSLAPRRVVAIELPDRSLTTAGVDRFVVDGNGTGPAVVSYAVAGQPESTATTRLPLRTPDGPIVLESAGQQTIVLRLLDRDGGPIVVAQRRG